MAKNRILIRCEDGKCGFWMRRTLRRTVNTVLAAERIHVPCEVNILVTDDVHIHELNRQFRQVDKPTDVLSFPAQELVPEHFDPDAVQADPDSGCLPLGDMVLSQERAAAQAQEFGHSLKHEMAYLTAHSVLHLLGYDHMDEGPEKRRMRAKEKAVMALMKMNRR